MNDTITIDRTELAQFVRSTAKIAVDQTLSELGIKKKIYKPWISQSEAYRLLGRRRATKAMMQGELTWRKPNMDKKTGRVYILRKDVEKLLNEPQ